MFWNHEVPPGGGQTGRAVKEDFLEEVMPKLSLRDRFRVGSVKRQAAWGRGKEATDTEAGCICQGKEWGRGVAQHGGERFVLDTLDNCGIHVTLK